MRITSPVRFENPQAYCPAELGENRKGHCKLSLGPQHLPPPQPWKRKARIVRWTKVRGAAGFGSALNGPGPEGLGQVLGSLFKAGSAGGSHLQHKGLHTAPEARLPFASHPGGGWRFLSHCWHLRPPPSVRDKRLEAELTHNYHSEHSGPCAQPCPD